MELEMESDWILDQYYTAFYGNEGAKGPLTPTGAGPMAPWPR